MRMSSRRSARSSTAILDEPGRGPSSETQREPSLHIIVLAAGRGSRLRALADHRSKWLLPVGPRTIADRQVEAVAAVREALAPEEVTAMVVTGHAAEGVVDRAAAGGMRTLHNPEYLSRNNWWSVLLALRALPLDDRPVVVMNGDLCARSTWLAAFLEHAARTSSESLIAVDLQRVLTDESMKVAAHPDGGSARTLRDIGKVDIADPVGEYVGLLMFRGSVREQFERSLRAFESDPVHDNEWYEGAVRTSAAAGTGWVLWPTPDTHWFEIDDEADHERAVAVLGTS